MLRRPPRSTRTDTLFPYTTLFRSPERLDALIALIDGAKESLRILYYIFCADESGTRVRDALIAAVDRGVKVALLIDGFGSDAVQKDFFAPLTDTDCAFFRFSPRFGRDRKSAVSVKSVYVRVNLGGHGII